MAASSWAIPAIFLGALVLQAVLPAYRTVLVLAGAAATCVVSSLGGTATTSELLQGVPWDVLVILVGLGLITELLVESRLFGVLAAVAARASGGHRARIPLLFGGAMYLVSGLVNNLTALLLVLPVMLNLMKLVGVTRRFTAWSLGLVIVCCNLGGAATPIGDFPAILLLGRGSMGFVEYLVRALPVTALAVAITLAVVWVVRPDRGMEHDPLLSRLSVDVMGALYRNVRVSRRLFLPTAAILVAMFAAWISLPARGPISPELVCWLGAVAVLLLAGRRGERLVRTRVDVEAALFLLALFVMVGAVRRAGVFEQLARALSRLPLPPGAQLVVFLVAASLVTGVFSAGPGMAALLDVAETMTDRLPRAAVFVGLAMAVCAGSSLFLTAATAGPLAQSLTERADVRDLEGEPVRFRFFDHQRAGLVGYAVTLGVGIGWALWVAR